MSADIYKSFYIRFGNGNKNHLYDEVVNKYMIMRMRQISFLTPTVPLAEL